MTGLEQQIQLNMAQVIVPDDLFDFSRDLYLELSDHSASWQALRQCYCLCVCQIAKWCGNLNYQFRGFMTSQENQCPCRCMASVTIQQEAIKRPGHSWWGAWLKLRVWLVGTHKLFYVFLIVPCLLATCSDKPFLTMLCNARSWYHIMLPFLPKSRLRICLSMP